MRKILLLALLGVGVFGAECSSYLRVATIGAKSQMSQIEDEYSKLTEVSCENEVMTYKYQLKNSPNLSWELIKGEDRETILSEMKNTLVEEFCSDKDTLTLLKKADSISMNYYLQNSELFGNLKITAKDCK